MISNLIFLLVIVTAAIFVAPAIAMFIAERRRKPYTWHDLCHAMDRICAGAEELWRLRHEAAFAASREDKDEDEAKHALRRLCAGMLDDMLENTGYIFHWAQDVLRQNHLRLNQEERGKAGTPETDRRATERHGTELVLLVARLVPRLRWTQLRLAFRPDHETLCSLTAEAVEQYACLWEELAGFLEAQVCSPVPVALGRRARVI